MRTFLTFLPWEEKKRVTKHGNKNQVGKHTRAWLWNPTKTTFKVTFIRICLIDTVKKILNGRPKAYFFKAYSKVKNLKVGSFRSQKNLISQNA